MFILQYVLDQAAAECYIKVIDDDEIEQQENFKVILSSPFGSDLGDLIETTVIIDENLKRKP